MWFPYNGKPNQIRGDSEKHMKHTVIEFGSDNELVAFNNNIIGNYSTGSFLGNIKAHQSPFLDNAITSHIKNLSYTNSSKCKIFVKKPVVNTIFWTLYFDGSKSNDGAGAGCILISQEGEKTMLFCILEFKCTNNTAEYEALVQGLYKAISPDIKYLQVFED